MNKKLIIKQISIVLLIAVVSGVVGYFIGNRQNNDVPNRTTTTVKYVKGETVHDTIVQPSPVKISFIKVPQNVPIDTAQVVKDYFANKTYALDFSNDTLGTFKVNAEVGQNSIIKATSVIQPLIRTVETEKVVYKSKSQFFVMGGTSVDLKTNQLTFGVDIKGRVLLGVSGIRNRDSYGYTLNVGIKW